MGLTDPSEILHKNQINTNLWHLPWHSINAGGTLLFTVVLVLLSIIGVLTTYTNHNAYKEQLEEVNVNLEEAKKKYFLEEQYQYALNDKHQPLIGDQYAKFNQPTSFSEMKSYLKKWQTNLRIKTLNVTMETEKAHKHGKNIFFVPMRFTVHLLNDKTLYQLLEKIQNEAPGLVVVKHVDLKRVAGSNPETIDQLLIGKTNTLIEGTVVCDWFFIGTDEQ